MTQESGRVRTKLGGMQRLALWGAGASLVALPAVAMRFTDEVAWDLTDFLVAGGLVASVCAAYELAAKASGARAYRAAAAVALAAGFLLVWANLAVGVIGSEDNPANLMYGGVLAVAAAGAAAARLRPDGMARAMAATALAQVAPGVVSELAGWGSAPGVTLFFTGLWLVSAWLFRSAARDAAQAR